MEFKDQISEIDASILSIDERSKQIEARAAELGDGIDAIADKAELEKRGAEADSLAREKAELAQKREALASQKEELAKKRGEEALRASKGAQTLNESERKKQMENEIEERAAKFVEAARRGEGKISAREIAEAQAARRSIALNGVSAPAGNKAEVGHHYAFPKVMDYVNVINVPNIGEWRGTYGKNDGSGEGTYTFPIVNVYATDEFDKGILACSNVQIEQYVTEKITYKVFSQLAKNITAKLAAQKDDKNAAMYATLTVASIGATTLRDIMLSAYGADDVYGPSFLIMSRENLVKFGAVRGSNEKKAVYEIEFPDPSDTNHGRILDGGLACDFIIDNSVEGLLFGKLAAVDVVLAGDFNVALSKEEKFSSGMITCRGDVYAAYGSTVKDAITVVTVTA